jgi:hypothetical protein
MTDNNSDPVIMWWLRRWGKRGDDHKENIGMLINLISFNQGQFILIRKHRVDTRYEILTYSATTFSKLDDTS